MKKVFEVKLNFFLPIIRNALSYLNKKTAKMYGL